MFETPIKIITREEAIKMGLTNPVRKLGGGSMEVGLVAMGKIGEKKAERIELHNLRTGEKHVLFDKGKRFKFKGWKKK